MQIEDWDLGESEVKKAEERFKVRYDFNAIQIFIKTSHGVLGFWGFGVLGHLDQCIEVW